MRIDDCKKDIETYLKNYFKGRESYNKLIYEAESYSLNMGGKRIRPILMLLVYSIYKDSYKEILEMAASIEMIHTYSLIHDDLPAMDNDDLRRGKPTNHKVFGDGIATLAGDALLNEAMIIMMKLSLKNGENALRASKEIAEAPKKDIEAFDLFGRKLGLAFQIKDDILDVTGSTEKLGKKAHADEELNKCNFITMYGLEKCEKLCKDLSYESISLLNSITKDTSYLKELTLSLLEREY